MKKYSSYKNSGVDYIGEIPSDWSVIKIKHLFVEINEKSTDGLEDLLSVSQYTGVTPKKDKIDEEEDNLTNAATLEGYKLVQKNDLVINIMLAWNGSLGVSDYNGIASPAYCVYRLKEDYNPKYFDYLFKTEIYKAEFKRNSTGIIDSRLRLYTDKFFNIYSILPSRQVQDKIVDYLEKKIKLFDALIFSNSLIFGKSNRKTGLLQEYKHTLIYEAVTGNIFTENEALELKDATAYLNKYSAIDE